jgi:hypothetical protein
VKDIHDIFEFPAWALLIDRFRPMMTSALCGLDNETGDEKKDDATLERDPLPEVLLNPGMPARTVVFDRRKIKVDIERGIIRTQAMSPFDGKLAFRMACLAAANAYGLPMNVYTRERLDAAPELAIIVRHAETARPSEITWMAADEDPAKHSMREHVAFGDDAIRRALSCAVLGGDAISVARILNTSRGRSIVGSLNDDHRADLVTRLVCQLSCDVAIELLRSPLTPTSSQLSSSIEAITKGTSSSGKARPVFPEVVAVIRSAIARSAIDAVFEPVQRSLQCSDRKAPRAALVH